MQGPIEGTAAALLGIAMLGAFACALGGGWMIMKGGDRKKGALLLVMAAVLVGNVLVWSV